MLTPLGTGMQHHDYSLYRSPNGGCCDCGDLVSWKHHCAKHRRDAAAAPRAVEPVPPALRSLTRELLGVALEVAPGDSTPKGPHCL
jgi:hypothetical protein